MRPQRSVPPRSPPPEVTAGAAGRCCCAPVGCRPDLQGEVPDAEKPEAGRHGSWERQEASLAVLPDQDGALLDRAVPQLYEESAHPTMLVVSVPEPDSGAPLQGVPGVEGPTEDPLGGSAEGDWEGEEPVEGPGPPSGREVRASGTGPPPPPRNYVGRRAPAEEEAVSEVSQAELREWEEEQEAEELGGGEGLPLLLPTPDFMASAGEE